MGKVLRFESYICFGSKFEGHYSVFKAFLKILKNQTNMPMEFLEFVLAIWVKSKSYSELWEYYFHSEPWETNFDKPY